MKKALVVYNPVAGAKKLRNSKKIIENTLKKEGYDYDFFETIKAKKQPLEQFIGGKYDKIIVSGGDGTVAEVTSFLIHNKIKTPLVIIPQGSANILAISLMIPLNVGMALSRGLKKEAKVLDAMRVNGKRYGMIATGCGYDTLVMEKTSRSLKQKIGFFAYIWTVIKTLLIYRSRPYKLTIDGKREVLTAKTIMCFNILPLGHLKINESVLGGKVVANDGLLNVFALNPGVARSLAELKRTTKVFKGKKISIKTKKARRYQIDGDVLKGKTITIEVLPKAIFIAY